MLSVPQLPEQTRHELVRPSCGAHVRPCLGWRRADRCAPEEGLEALLVDLLQEGEGEAVEARFRNYLKVEEVEEVVVGHRQTHPEEVAAEGEEGEVQLRLDDLAAEGEEREERPMDELVR